MSACLMTGFVWANVITVIIISGLAPTVCPAKKSRVKWKNRPIFHVYILALVTANLTDTPLSGTIAGPQVCQVTCPRLPTWDLGVAEVGSDAGRLYSVCSSAPVLKGGHFLGLTTRVTHAHPASRISLGWFCATRISEVFLVPPCTKVWKSMLCPASPYCKVGSLEGIKGESEMDPRNERPCKQCCHLVRWMSASLRGGLGRL